MWSVWYLGLIVKYGEATIIPSLWGQEIEDSVIVVY